MKRWYNDTMIRRFTAHTPPLTACGRIVWMNLVHKARNDLERGLSSRHACPSMRYHTPTSWHRWEAKNCRNCAGLASIAVFSKARAHDKREI